jgi:hypothetical protein
MTLTPNFLPVGSVVEYNIGTTDKPEWSATVLDCQDLDWLVRSKDDFNLSHRPVPLTPEILTEWCKWEEMYKSSMHLTLEFEIKEGEWVYYYEWYNDDGSIKKKYIQLKGIELDILFLHELQLLFLGMKQVLPITIK